MENKILPRESLSLRPLLHLMNYLLLFHHTGSLESTHGCLEPPNVLALFLLWRPGRNKGRKGILAHGSRVGGG